MKIDASSSGQRQVSVTGLDNDSNRNLDIARWIDRVHEQDQLLEGIKAQRPLLEVVGASGFGKSWLAAWVYEQVKSQCDVESQFDRALWVNFRKVPSFNQFSRWVLQEIGFLLDERTSDEDLIGELVYRLGDRGQVLLVMDQLEVIQESPDSDSFVRFLERWQHRGRKSTVLVTTQRSLLKGESAAIDCLNLAGLSATEGETLLRQNYQINQAIDNGLSRLVEVAGGHPLLLNLAANWLKQESRTAVDSTSLVFF